MQITNEMVKYVAELSRLDLSEEQTNKAQADLGSILDYIDTLNNIDTNGVEPMSHVFAVKNVLREDKIVPSYDREVLLANAPKRDEEAFLVPKTVE